MLKTAAIICEYNPFHNGHAFQTAKVREVFGDCAAVCVMSGSFVQRGEAAVADKYTRARAALMNGADLVLELPFPYSAASAEYFAEAGVYIAGRVGADILCFGSESADIDGLRRISDACDSGIFKERMADALEDGENGNVAYAVLRERILRGLLPDMNEEMFRSPNDILGAAYLSAMKKSAPGTFAYCNERAAGERYLSAAEIRGQLYAENYRAVKPYMPPSSVSALSEAFSDGCFPASLENAERAVLGLLRFFDPERCDGFAESAGGLGRRIVKKSLSAVSLASLYEAAATKKFTDARIRRAILYMLCGVTTDDLKKAPAYTMLLAANKRGCALLSQIDPSLTVITKPGDYTECSDEVKRQFELTLKAERLYTLCLPKVAPTGRFISATPYIEK